MENRFKVKWFKMVPYGIDAQGMLTDFKQTERTGEIVKGGEDLWASDHIAEQAAMIGLLNEKGYCAKFACGTDEAMSIIDNYMKL